MAGYNATMNGRKKKYYFAIHQIDLNFFYRKRNGSISNELRCQNMNLHLPSNSSKKLQEQLRSTANINNAEVKVDQTKQ